MSDILNSILAGPRGTSGYASESLAANARFRRQQELEAMAAQQAGAQIGVAPRRNMHREAIDDFSATAPGQAIEGAVNRVMQPIFDPRGPEPYVNSQGQVVRPMGGVPGGPFAVGASPANKIDRLRSAKFLKDVVRPLSHSRRLSRHATANKIEDLFANMSPSQKTAMTAKHSKPVPKREAWRAEREAKLDAWKAKQKEDRLIIEGADEVEPMNLSGNEPWHYDKILDDIEKTARKFHLPKEVKLYKDAVDEFGNKIQHTTHGGPRGEAAWGRLWQGGPHEGSGKSIHPDYLNEIYGPIDDWIPAMGEGYNFPVPEWLRRIPPHSANAIIPAAVLHESMTE